MLQLCLIGLKFFSHGLTHYLAKKMLTQGLDEKWKYIALKKDQ